METSGRGPIRVAVRIGSDVWREEVERFDRRSGPRVAAERERARLEGVGVDLAKLVRCADEEADGTRLGGLLKVYVPIAREAPSERPYGFVLSPGGEGTYLALVAFGERHPR